MNQVPFEVAVQNPWKSRETLNYPRPVALVPVAILFLLSSLELVFFHIEIFSMITFGILCAGVIMILRVPRLSVLPLLTAAIPVVMLRSFTLGAAVLAVIVGVASGAMLLTANRNIKWTVLLPVVAWAISYAVTRDAKLACMSLLILPAAVLLAVATKMHQRRTTAICMTVGGLLLSVVALLAAYLMQTYGSVSRDVLLTYFETQRLWLVDLMIAARDEAITLLQTQMGEQSAETVSSLLTVMSRENISMIISMLYNILPALIIVLTSILAFEAQSFLCGMYFANGMNAVLTPVSTGFTMSTASAILYLASFFLLLFAPAEGLFSAVVENIYLILTPGLLLMGWTSTVLRWRMSRGMSRPLFIILAVGLVLLSPASIPSLLAFIGAFTVIVSAIGMRWVQKMRSQMSAEEFEAWRRDFMARGDRRDPHANEPRENENDNSASSTENGNAQESENQNQNDSENKNENETDRDDQNGDAD